MKGRYIVFPLAPDGSMFAFDDAIGASDILPFAQSIAFLGAQYLQRDVWVFDQSTGRTPMPVVARFSPVRVF